MEFKNRGETEQGLTTGVLELDPVVSMGQSGTESGINRR
jgi:hypothetical protein